MPDDVTKTLKDKLSPEELEEISEKEWNKAELPTEEELASAKSSSPMARNNPNSRKNLAQYNERSKESKERSLKNLRIKENKRHSSEVVATERRKDFIDFFPVEDIMDSEEQELYYGILEMYMSDFNKETLSAIDLDGILTLAMNRVLEKRLFRLAHDRPTAISDVMPSIEKLQKQNEKIKESLGSRRKDRVDPKAEGNETILDIAHKFDLRHKENLKKMYNEPEDVNSRSSFRAKMDSIVNND